MTTISKSLQEQSLHHRRSLGRVITTPDVFCVTGKALEFSGSGGTLSSSGLPGYSMPGTMVSTAAGFVSLPAMWAGHITEIFAVWRPVDTVSGDVQFQFSIRRLYDLSSTGLVLENVIVTDASPQHAGTVAVSVGTLSPLPVNIANSELIRLEVQRIGTAAADSYNNLIYLLAVGWRLADGA